MPDATSLPCDPPLDNEPLHEVADSYAEVLGAALIRWLRANAPAVRAVLDLEDDDPRG